jgi:hypothetical protein
MLAKKTFCTDTLPAQTQTQIQTHMLPAGGTVLTLLGRGFPTSAFQTLTVTLFGSQTPEPKQLGCSLISANASSVLCLVNPTPPPAFGSPSSQVFTVSLATNGGQARCEVEGGCVFEMSDAATPTVLGVSAATVAWGSNLTILVSNVGSDQGNLRGTMAVATLSRLYPLPYQT